MGKNAGRTVSRKTGKSPASHSSLASNSEAQSLYDLFMQAPALIAVVKGPDHIFEIANPLSMELIGTYRGDIIGKPVREVMPELESQVFIKLLDNVYKSGKAYHGKEVRSLLDRTGTGELEEAYLNFVYQPYRDAEGRVQGILVHAIDVTEQIQSRKRVEESEARFKAIFNQAAVAMAIIGLDRNWLDFNTAFPKMFGYLESELKKLNFIDLTHPEDRASDKQAIDGLLRGEKTSFVKEKRYLHKNGSVVWGTVHVSLVRNDEGEPQYFVAAVQDITARKQIEENLQISETRHRTMIEQSPLSIQILSPDGMTLQVNKAWEDLWGATLEQLKGYNMLKDKQLEELGIMAFIKRGFSGEPALIPAVRYVPQDTLPDVTGVPYRWVQAYVYPVKDKDHTIREVVLVHQDITEQKESDEALKESEARLRFMAETVPQKIFTAQPDGNVDYLNPHWLEYTGLPFDEIKGWGWKDMVHPEDMEDNVARWQYSINTGEPFSFEQRFRRHDGQYRWHISRARAMRDSNGEIVMWVGANTDIHDIKSALERERRLEAQTASLAEQRTQLITLNRAKDEFISLASHQLRTPATGVKQYLGMVLEGYAGELTVEQSNMLGQAHESNERQIAIINDLLQVAHLDAGKVKLHKDRVNLVELLQDVVQEQTSKFERRRQRVELKYLRSEITAIADELRLRMVLDNLLDNASKYSHDDTAITVAVSQSGGQARVTIKDCGVGMDEGDLDKLFRKFTRLDNPLSIVAGGTGLGLYWVKKIIDLHGGSIEVESSPGVGSTFKISLPT